MSIAPASATDGRLAGRACIVTGAASGFGAAIAETYAAQGARVMVADLNDDAGRAVAQRIGGAYTHCDVADGAQVQALVQAAVAAFGRLDVVVNNAGTTHRNMPALEVDEAAFDRIYRVNVKSLFHMTRAAVPAMRPGASGSASSPSGAGIRVLAPSRITR